MDLNEYYVDLVKQVKELETEIKEIEKRAEGQIADLLMEKAGELLDSLSGYIDGHFEDFEITEVGDIDVDFEILEFTFKGLEFVISDRMGGGTKEEDTMDEDHTQTVSGYGEFECDENEVTTIIKLKPNKDDIKSERKITRL